MAPELLVFPWERPMRSGMLRTSLGLRDRGQHEIRTRARHPTAAAKLHCTYGSRRTG